jgi:hypothetical protein
VKQGRNYEFNLTGPTALNFFRGQSKKKKKTKKEKEKRKKRT